jgi:phage terminase large subunit
MNINLPEVVGKGYGSFWRSKKRYRVVKGGRGSKKSKTTALYYIYQLGKHPLANLVVVRRIGNTNKDSTYAELKWAAKRLGVYDLWTFTTSPLQAVYNPTGQKILFRGFDDPLKLTSLAVDTGYLCWAWFEEAFEIEEEDDFATFDEGIRGELPEGLWKQLTLTFNPWTTAHWTKERFFDKTDPNAFTLTTTHHCNEFLDQADHDKIEALKISDPERYLVVGLGEYGIPGGAYFDEFRKETHVIDAFDIPIHWKKYRVLDYGLDMLACLWIAIDTKGTAYIYREAHEPNLIISEAANLIREMTPREEEIEYTYAPPDLWARQRETGKSTAILFAEYGVPLYKSNNSRIDGWLATKEWLKPYEIKSEQTGKMITVSDIQIFKSCVYLILYLPQVRSNTKNINDVDTEPHYLTHITDALRYFCIMFTYPSRPLPKPELTEQEAFQIKPKNNEMLGAEPDDSYLYGGY